jgi:fermentation-respiration switch protein FrsA (DUF1100 family)
MNRCIFPVLYTDAEGFSRFGEIALPLSEGTPLSRLTRQLPAAGLQFRESPAGFASDWHCTTAPQFTLILAGKMEIVLRDGSTRIFMPGECFYSTDTLPEGESFNPQRHGHRSRLVGEGPLRTLFIQGEQPDFVPRSC